jgi:hypothetical protein
MGRGRLVLGLALTLPILLMPSPWLAVGTITAVNVGLTLLGYRHRDVLILSSTAVWQLMALASIPLGAALRFLVSSLR